MVVLYHFDSLDDYIPEKSLPLHLHSIHINRLYLCFHRKRGAVRNDKIGVLAFFQRADSVIHAQMAGGV